MTSSEVPKHVFQSLVGQSLWPLEWWWCPEERLTDEPNATQKALHTREVKCGRRLETMSQGIPWRWLHQQLPYAVEGSLGRGTKWAALEKRSTIVSITVCLSDGGRPVTKSMAIWDH